LSVGLGGIGGGDEDAYQQNAADDERDLYRFQNRGEAAFMPRILACLRYESGPPVLRVAAMQRGGDTATDIND